MTAECESPCLSIRWPKPTIRCLLAKATHTHRSALSGSQSRETSLRRLIGAPTQAIREHGRCPPAPALSLSLLPSPPHVSRGSLELAEVLTPHELTRPFWPTSVDAFRETHARLLAYPE